MGEQYYPHGTVVPVSTLEGFLSFSRNRRVTQVFFEKPDPVQGSLFIFGCSSNLRCLYKPVQIFDPIRLYPKKL